MNVIQMIALIWSIITFFIYLNESAKGTAPKINCFIIIILNAIQIIALLNV